MPLANTVSSLPLLGFDMFILFKIAFVAFFGLYFIFSVLVIREVQLMTENLITEVSPIIRAFSILHAGLSLGILVLSIVLF